MHEKLHHSWLRFLPREILLSENLPVKLTLNKVKGIKEASLNQV